MSLVFLLVSFFLLSLALTYGIREFAIKKAFLDMPNHRSSHQTPTPYGGGVAIAISWFVGISYLYQTNELDASLYFTLMMGVFISVLSQIDDMYSLSAKTRLFVHSIIAIFALYFLGGMHQIDLGFFIIQNQIVTNIFAFLIIVYFINIYNFLDGIDGYAGSEAVFLALAGFLLFGGEYFLLLAFCVLGFLVFNWQKASIFMGDAGSTLLGYNIAVFALYHQNMGSSILVWITLFGVFFFDASITLFRRFKNGENILKAHKKHAYQRLTQSGYSHQKVVILAMVVNMILFAFVYFISNALMAFLLCVVFMYAVMRFVDAKKAFK